MYRLRVVFDYFRAGIWRFKEDNRGLMRRLYGDMESASVYREMRATMGHMSDSSFRYQKPKSKRSGPMLAMPRTPSASSILATDILAVDPTKGGFPALKSQYKFRVGTGVNAKEADKKVSFTWDGSGTHITYLVVLSSRSDVVRNPMYLGCN